VYPVPDARTPEAPEPVPAVPRRRAGRHAEGAPAPEDGEARQAAGLEAAGEEAAELAGRPAVIDARSGLTLIAVIEQSRQLVEWSRRLRADRKRQPDHSAPSLLREALEQTALHVQQTCARLAKASASLQAMGTRIERSQARTMKR
jgi:hypothetical protein